eukprot:545383-Prorocentrum_minimum.AAC.4
MAVLTAGSYSQMMRDAKSVLAGTKPSCSRPRVCERARQQAYASVSRPYQSTRKSGRRYATAAIAPPRIEPVLEEVSAFSPATVANLGAGFDFMGCAVEVRLGLSTNGVFNRAQDF